MTYFEGITLVCTIFFQILHASTEFRLPYVSEWFTIGTFFRCTDSTTLQLNWFNRFLIGSFLHIYSFALTFIMLALSSSLVVIWTLYAPIWDRSPIWLWRFFHDSSHSNLTRCCHSGTLNPFLIPEPIFVIMEYVAKGKLQEFLRKSRAEHYYGNLHGMDRWSAQVWLWGLIWLLLQGQVKNLHLVILHLFATMWPREWSTFRRKR